MMAVLVPVSAYAETQVSSLSDLFIHTTKLNVGDGLIILNGDKISHSLSGHMPEGYILHTGDISPQDSITLHLPAGNYTFVDSVNSTNVAVIQVVDPYATLIDKNPVVNDTNHKTPLQLPVDTTSGNNVGLNDSISITDSVNSTTTGPVKTINSTPITTTNNTSTSELEAKIDQLNTKIDTLQQEQLGIFDMLSKIVNFLRL